MRTLKQDIHLPAELGQRKDEMEGKKRKEKNILGRGDGIQEASRTKKRKVEFRKLNWSNWSGMHPTNRGK